MSVSLGINITKTDHRMEMVENADKLRTRNGDTLLLLLIAASEAGKSYCSRLLYTCIVIIYTYYTKQSKKLS